MAKSSLRLAGSFLGSAGVGLCYVPPTLFMSSRSQDDSGFNGNDNQRGGTWCELNPLWKDGEDQMQAIFFCMEGANSGPNQETSCCPYDEWSAITTGSPSPAANYLHTTYPETFKAGGKVLYNGQKKKLWDIVYGGRQDQNPNCGGSMSAVSLLKPQSASSPPNTPKPQDCITEGTKKMCFKWGSDSKVHGGEEMTPFTWTTTVDPMYAKEFKKGKLHPIARDPQGQVWALQSYMTEKSPGVPMYENVSTDAGEETNICEYLKVCCSGLPQGWELQCGILKSNIACGKKHCKGDVTVDDFQGAWCLIDESSAEADVCTESDAEGRTCGCGDQSPDCRSGAPAPPPAPAPEDSEAFLLGPARSPVQALVLALVVFVLATSNGS